MCRSDEGGDGRGVVCGGRGESGGARGTVCDSSSEEEFVILSKRKRRRRVVSESSESSGDILLCDIIVDRYPIGTRVRKKFGRRCFDGNSKQEHRM